MIDLSKFWGHLGTLLAGLGAGLADTGVLHVGASTSSGLTWVAGLLVALHVITSKQAKTAESEVSRVIKAIGGALKEPAPASTQAAAGTSYPTQG